IFSTFSAWTTGAWTAAPALSEGSTPRPLRCRRTGAAGAVADDDLVAFREAAHHFAALSVGDADADVGGDRLPVNHLVDAGGLALRRCIARLGAAPVGRPGHGAIPAAARRRSRGRRRLGRRVLG